MHVPGQRSGAAVARDLRCSERVGLVVSAKSAMFARDADSQQAGFVQIAIVLGRKARVMIVPRRTWREAFRGETLHRGDQRCLIGRQTECGGIKDRRGQRHKSTAPKYCFIGSK